MGKEGGFVMEEQHNRAHTPDDRRMRAELRKKRQRKLLLRRTLIVSAAILIIAALVLLIVMIGQALMGQTPQRTVETEAATPDDATPAYTAALNFSTPQIADDKKTEGAYSTLIDGVYLYNKRAFRTFDPDDGAADSYADALSGLKRKAPELTIYNMIVPTAIEFGVPDRLKESSVTTASQSEFIRSVYSGYSADVVPVNCYNTLCDHLTEYTYFGTDSRWTALGAYYAYGAFMDALGERTLNLDICTEHTIDGFEGSLVYADDGLWENLDTVHFWTFPFNTYAERTDNMGDEPYTTTVYYEGESGGAYAFGVFLWGDGALVVEHNTDLQNGKKIAVVKDSFGNPFAPYLAANYEEVHVIDYNYYSGSIKSYCRNNDIDEVLILMSVSDAGDTDEIVRLQQLF